MSFSPTKPPPTKYCKNCTHFLPNTTFYSNHQFALRYGYCKLYGDVDLQTGEVSYTSASVARKYECKGQFYEPKPPEPPTPWQEWLPMSRN